MSDNTLSPQQKKGYILIAEDEVDYAEIYEFKLKNEGYEVLVVPNGEITLQKIREKKPDLLLLDIMMPIKDGFEVLEDIKKDSVFANLKVIVLSNLGQKDEIERAKDLGAVDYIVKSNTSFQDVINKVKEHLAK
ncbi:response regulator [Candidatus Peregrinibacteria bacterium]|nr:response regulator [Candidatus Peregrinibacteria bacterium]